MRFRKTRSTFLVLAVIAIPACNDSVIEPPIEVPVDSVFGRVVGAYGVVFANGRGVPFVHEDQGACIVLYGGGWLVVSPDSSWMMGIDRLIHMCNGEVVRFVERVESGSLQLRGDTLHFVSADTLNRPFIALYVEAQARDVLIATRSSDLLGDSSNYLLQKLEHRQRLQSLDEWRP